MTDAPVLKPPRSHGGFKERPSTRMGWLSFWFAIAFVVMMGVNQTVLMNLPELDGIARGAVIVYGLAMLAVGLTAGLTGLIAMWRKGERSAYVVLLPVIVGLFVLMLVLGEVFFEH